MISTKHYSWERSHPPFLDECTTLRELRRHRVHSVLVAGSGSVETGLYLAGQGLTCVTVVEGNDRCLDEAVQWAEREMLTGITFIESDTPFRSLQGPYDCVICPEELSLASDPTRELREFGRVLRRGGLLVFAVYALDDDTFDNGQTQNENDNIDIRYYDRHRVSELVHGWSDVKIEPHGWFHEAHGPVCPRPHWHTVWVVWAHKPEN